VKNDRVFLRCEKCGNIVRLIEDAGVGLICCGGRMKRMLPNTADASREKHVPVAEKTDGFLTVSIGAAPHPMTPGHHIAWIAVAQANITQIATIEDSEKPEAEFRIREGPVTLYAYCNLHGLWASEA